MSHKFYVAILELIRKPVVPEALDHEIGKDYSKVRSSPEDHFEATSTDLFFFIFYLRVQQWLPTNQLVMIGVIS